VLRTAFLSAVLAEPHCLPMVRAGLSPTAFRTDVCRWSARRRGAIER
jgi:hypothetical protein